MHSCFSFIVNTFSRSQCKMYKHFFLFSLFEFEFDFWCFNATFSNISPLSWRPVLVAEEAGVPGENHRPVASHQQTNKYVRIVLVVFWNNRIIKQYIQHVLFNCTTSISEITRDIVVSTYKLWVSAIYTGYWVFRIQVEAWTIFWKYSCGGRA